MSLGNTYYQKGCDLGELTACYNLGMSYENGTGVKKDITKGMKLYSRSCYLYNGQGYYNYGIHYALGIGVEQNLTKARQLYTKAKEYLDRAISIQQVKLPIDHSDIERSKNLLETINEALGVE